MMTGRLPRHHPIFKPLEGTSSETDVTESRVFVRFPATVQSLLRFHLCDSVSRPCPDLVGCLHPRCFHGCAERSRSHRHLQAQAASHAQREIRLPRFDPSGRTNFAR